MKSLHHPPGAPRLAFSGKLALLLAALLAGGSSAYSQATPTLFIREYRVQGSTVLSALEIEEAVYPFLGPGRTVDDVDQARAALEKAFRDKGFQTVSVLIPNQDPRTGVIRLEVVEGKIGRLRVNGARYFLPSRIKDEAPSLAEGSVPDFNKVKEEILALNRLPDRQVKPELRPGAEPGTYDVDLNVEDKSPLHASLELNNRYSANTTPLRLNAAISYANLFQLGHTLGVNFQIAPERADDALVYSANYMFRVSDGISLMFQGTKQDSDISTLGGSAVVGQGEIIGLRALFDLPASGSFSQSFSLGMDYKSLDEETFFGAPVTTSIDYYPISANYGASWVKPNSFTEANASLNFHLRGMGSSSREFNDKRYKADGSYIYLRGDVSHTRDLKDGSQLFAKVQGQLSSQPLINSEQYSGGGLGNARGYLEATALGDNGVFATAEYRSPSFIGKKDADGKQADEWRLHAFVDGGTLTVLKPLPGQKSFYNFLSAGAGTRFRFREHYNGSLDLAVPFNTQAEANSGDVRITFRGWAEF
ncbi:ShlB/FhaC/HecB family hemolysin secretion/activation protein [Luteolibacter sp. Populi]|uniref:ShlB/FhaC/HecB family hemolysin secretion/activation protein n=1 Tax=Luteolibacter sp. Populi TaxID=3230487 RepID=UPI003467B7E1